MDVRFYRLTVMKGILVVASVLIGTGLMAGCSAAHGVHPQAVPLIVHVSISGGPLGRNGTVPSHPPSSHSEVDVTGSDGALHQAQTDSNGSATFSVEPGSYTVAWPACGDESRQVSVRPGPPNRVEIDCPLA